MKDKKKMIIIGVSFLISIIFVVYLAKVVIPKVLVTASRASASAKVSIKNSLIIGEKIMAKANGIEKCVVDVFVVDADGKGINGKQVQLVGMGGKCGSL